MENSSIRSLLEAVEYNSYELLNQSAVCDYFGIVSNDNEYDAVNDTNISDFVVVFGLYTGLIKHLKVEVKTIEKHMKRGKLNKLMHSKYKNHNSAYYEIFCNRNINLDAFHISKK